VEKDIASTSCPYLPEAGVHDELCDVGGGLRPKWRHLIQTIAPSGGDELGRRRRQAQRLLYEDGACYSVHGDPAGLNRPWEIDPVPLLIAGEEWGWLEAALQQRARVLDYLLADLYGPRELLQEGIVPPELVYGHRAFLRPCDGIQLPGPHALVLYAADVARGADGSFRVLGDRAQAPAGVGYALENRSVMSRILPAVSRQAHVHPLNEFFRTLDATLQALAPTRDEPARVVLLTPGPHNEAYFEHAYLASYLGYSLVRGSDLTVQDGRVWLRSLGGLEPVHVILRRTADYFCDPLELRQDSMLGTPGLVEAARRGNVSIVNPLGAGLLENPGLLPFLPEIARHFLGEALQLPSAPTWWCGRPDDLEYVLAHLGELVIQAAAGGPPERPVEGRLLTRLERERLEAQIRFRPYVYVAQEPTGSYSVPVVAGARLEPRRAVSRLFAVAEGETFSVLPGALTRFAPGRGDRVAAHQLGGISKDTWVLVPETARVEDSRVESTQPPGSIDPLRLLPSRASEDLFWFGRYQERAEQGVRLLRTALRSLGESEDSVVQKSRRETLLQSLTHLTGTYPGFLRTHGDDRRGEPNFLAEPADELRALLFDEQRDGSVAFNIRKFLDSANDIRDLLSADAWRLLNDADADLVALRAATSEPEDAAPRLGALLKTLQAVTGNVLETMIRGPGWSFLEIGRRVERGLALTSLLRSTLAMHRDPAVEELLAEDVLSTVEMLVSYRRRFRAGVELSSVLDMLLLDESNPRALSYQLDRIQKACRHLPAPSDSRQRLRQEERLILGASTELRLADTTSLASAPLQGDLRQELDGLLERTRERLASAANAILHDYFTHVPESQQLVPTGMEGDA